MKKQYTTIQEFEKKFPDDDACLEHIFNLFYGKNHKCPKCHKRGFYRAKKYKYYSCAWCGYKLSPLAGTIFHKSPTSLKAWFFAIYLMNTSKNGVAAKEIERQTQVTYKTAWRMMDQIRKLMRPQDSKLRNKIEIDDTYIGGKHEGKRGRGAEGKAIVFGMVERDGEIKAEVVENLKAKTLMPIIQENVEENSQIISDELKSYALVTKHGFDHEAVKHAVKEYVRGIIHVNNLEGFWSQLKRSIDGTHHWVSPQHLQSYVDSFAWRYNHRDSQIPLFDLLLSRAVLPLS